MAFDQAEKVYFEGEGILSLKTLFINTVHN
jgi:hypothetical protein